MCDSNMIEDDGFVTVHPNVHKSERSLEDMREKADIKTF